MTAETVTAVPFTQRVRRDMICEVWAATPDKEKAFVSALIPELHTELVALDNDDAPLDGLLGAWRDLDRGMKLTLRRISTILAAHLREADKAYPAA